MIEEKDHNDSVKRKHEEHLIKTLKFMHNHKQKLQSLNEPNFKYTCAEAPSNRVKNVINSYEKLLIQDLIPSVNNAILEKIMMVLVYLCDEIRELKEIAEKKFYTALQMFGQQPVLISNHSHTKANDGDEIHYSVKSGLKEKMIGQALPFLQDLCNFVDRCYDVVANLIQQLSSVYSEKDDLFKSSFQNIHLFSVFHSIGDILTALITLDNIIQNNTELLESWSAYKSMIAIARSDINLFETNTAELGKYEKLLISVDQVIMTNEIFSGCIEQNFELSFTTDDGNNNGDVINNREIKNQKKVICVRTNELFLDELLYCLKYQLDNAVSVITSNNDLYERYDVINSFSLYALYRHLIPAKTPPDKKLFKYLWSIQKIIPYIILADHIVWNVSDFLLPYSPYSPYLSDTSKLDPSNAALYRVTFTQQFDKELVNKCNLCLSQCAAWMILIESRMQPGIKIESSLINQTLDIRASILSKGLALVSKARHLIQSYLVIHSHLQMPLSKARLLDIASLIENIEAIKQICVRKESLWIETYTQLIYSLSIPIKSIIHTKKAQLEISTKKSDVTKKIDMISLLTMLDNILAGSSTFSSTRQSAINLIYEILSQNKLFNEKDGTQLNNLFTRLLAFTSMQMNIQKIYDLKFLYFHIELFEPLMSDIYQNPSSEKADMLSYLIGAFSNGAGACRNVFSTISSSSGNNNSQSIINTDKLFIYHYQKYICHTLYEHIIKPLCVYIEMDLRLQVHTKNLEHMPSIDPKMDNLKLFRPFLQLPPLKVLGVFVDIKSHVTQHLNSTFYDMTTVTLHDWHTYAEMRSLANQQYNLQLHDNFLPLGSLNQGLDVLQIMRNIHIFVHRFAYDMNMQQFVEFQPMGNSKHLNTIKIPSIVSSIHQHGMGIVNTTVNYTYQYLIQKFDLFSQFLFDDYIRGHLSREYRFYRKHRNNKEVNNVYPYERALKFVRDIRKLSTNSTSNTTNDNNNSNSNSNKRKKSFLDQFRTLITEIGNALGYIRMIRSASMNVCSEAIKFLPELQYPINNHNNAAGSSSNSASNSSSSYTLTTRRFADMCGDKVTKGTTVNNIVDNLISSSIILDEKETAGLSTQTITSASQLDDSIETLLKNFHSGNGDNDFFKVLVNVFQPVLLTPQHSHLSTFHMIIPALCISFIEATIQAKDNMYKSTRTSATDNNSNNNSNNNTNSSNNNTKEIYFADDGFAMGLAYCLSILKQTPQKDALHWQDMIRTRYEIDTKELEMKLETRAMLLQKAKDAKIAKMELKRKAQENERSLKKKNSTSSFFSVFGTTASTSTTTNNTVDKPQPNKIGTTIENDEDNDEEISDFLNTEDEYENNEEIRTLQMTARRLETQRRELEQLYVSLSSAEIFFKSTTTDSDNLLLNFY